MKRLLGSTLAQADAILLNRLVNEAIGEGDELEFKLRLPVAGNDQETTEFLRDVSQFANEHGGVILYGVAETQAKASKIIGLPGFKFDAERRRLNTLLEGLDPRIRPPEMREIQHPSGSVLAIGIDQSLNGPHRVVGPLRVGQFWRRRAAEKALMTTPELRQAFVQGGVWRDAIVHFRDSRLQRISTGEGVPRGTEGARVIALHVLPLGGPRPHVDLPAIEKDWQRKIWAAHSFPGITSIARPNIDGWISTSLIGARAHHVQVFREAGGLEARADIVAFEAGQGTPPPRILDGRRLEAWVADWARRALGWFVKADVAPPYAVMVSALGVRGYRLYNPSNFNVAMSTDSVIDVNELRLPVQVFEELPADPIQALRPTFDILWQSAGWPQSPLWENGRFAYEPFIAGSSW